jgi:hypothetical protein
MTNLPSPRSLPQILGELIDNYLSRLDESGIAPGISSLKPGSSPLALLEAVAMAEMKDQSALMSLLEADDIDRAKGVRLLRLGLKEGILPRGETYAKGQITITDSSFTSITSKIYAGKSAPIPGTTTLYVADASSFPASGRIFIGRGTINYEGPINYSAKAQVSGYWVLTLSSATSKYHSVSENIIVGQGLDRVINAGQVVGTPKTALSDSILFTTTQKVTIPDGESSITNVPIVAQVSGISGNIDSGAITFVQTPAFTGMTVTNPMPTQNGMAIEDDDHYRARIKSIKANRSKGTAASLETNTYGITSPDENAVVTSAKIAVGNSETTLFIDTGNGYEERTSGIDYESLITSAVGGETSFPLTYRPVAKAALESSNVAPFALSDGCALAIRVGDAVSEHTFIASEFNSIANATSYEVMASINADANINFIARTIENGTKIAIQAKAETQEDLELTTPDSDVVDAGPLLGFTTAKTYSLLLYKNDSLLYKDGLSASILSAPTSSWVSFTDGDTLIINVDGTGEKTYIFNDADFVTSETGYATVNASNSQSAWCTVINNKVVGITATVEGGCIRLTSNLGTNSRASIEINEYSTLVQKGMFNIASLSSTGKSKDYTLNRNLGTIELTSPLTAGDKLAAGTIYTRSYVDSGKITTVTLSADSYIWFSVDGLSEIIGHSLNSDHTLTLQSTDTTPVRRLTATNTGTGLAVYPFINVTEGDFLISTDPNMFSTPIGSTGVGAWRVSGVDPLGSWVEVDPAGDGQVHNVTNAGTAYAGLSFCRSITPLQMVTLASGSTYSPDDLVTALNDALIGVTAITYNNSVVRVSTNTYSSNGSIAVVAQNSAAEDLGFTITSSQNDAPHCAVIESGNSEVGTPVIFDDTFLTSFTAPLTIGANSVDGVRSDRVGNPRMGGIPSLTWMRSDKSLSDSLTRYGQNTYRTSQILAIPVDESYEPGLQSFDVGLQSLYDIPVTTYPFSDRLIYTGAYHLGPESNLSVVIDGDDSNKSYNIPMYRKLLPLSTVPYSSTLVMRDDDNHDIGGNPTPMGQTFGADFDFSNFVLYSHSRLATNKTNSSKTILWRTKNFNNAQCGNLEYKLPTAPAQPLEVSDFDIAGSSTTTVYLPSGAQREIEFPEYPQYVPLIKTTGADPAEICIITGFIGVTLERTNDVVTCTVTLPTGVAAHGLGAIIYLASTDPVNFPGGVKTITGTTSDTFTYSEAGGDVTATSYPLATVANSRGEGRIDLPLDFNAGAVAVGDVCYLGSFPYSDIETYHSVVEVGNSWFKLLDGDWSSEFVDYLPVYDSDYMIFYPVDQSVSGTGTTPPTATWISEQINSMATCPFTATATGSGSGTIVKSTYDYTLLGDVSDTSFDDGIVHIASSTYSSETGDYTLSTKYAISNTYPDWENEEFRLVPTTAKNVCDFINTPGISGIGLVDGNISASSNGGKVQLASSSLGSSSSIKLIGGTANSTSMTVKGSSVYEEDLVKATVTYTTSIDQGVCQGQSVSIDNTISIPRATLFTDDTTMTVGVADNVVTLSGAYPAWDWSGTETGPRTNGEYYFEKHGNFSVLHNCDFTHSFSNTEIVNGDYLTIFPAIGKWSNKDPLINDHGFASALIPMTGNKTLLVGGCDTYSLIGAALTGATFYDSTSSYDQDAKTWATASNYPISAAYMAGVELLDGKVLVCGGVINDTNETTASSYIYDPATDTWGSSIPMNAARARHAVVLLSDGRVLAIGGHTDTSGTPLATVELYDPDTGAWSTLGPQLTAAVINPTVLAYGRDQLIVFGAGSSVSYMPDIRTLIWSAGGNLTTGRYATSAKMLASGSILVFGGLLTNETDSLPAYTSEIYNTVNMVSTDGPEMNYGRGAASSVVLDDGRILSIGGLVSNVLSSACEIYDPVMNIWSWVNGPDAARLGSDTAILNVDGTITCVGGGYSTTPPNNLSNVVVELDIEDLGTNIKNTGTFRIVAHTEHTIWFENPNLEIESSQAVLAIRSRHSVMPSDTLFCGGDILGTANRGSWPVISTSLNNQWSFTVSGMTNISPTVIGTDVYKTLVYPATPDRFIMAIEYITPGNTASTVNLWLRPVDEISRIDELPLPYDRISEAAGSIISPLDKLNFSTSLSVGVDAYRYNTGLIGEVNKVLYGDTRDLSTYPGYIAAGQNIYIQPSLPRRIQVHIAVKPAPGATGVQNRVRNAVARVINGAGPNAIPFSDIVSAAKVDGVLSVVLISPTYDATHDCIAVQPFETPKILDLDADIQVSFIGA